MLGKFLFVVSFIFIYLFYLCILFFSNMHMAPGGGGVLNISLGGEVWHGPSYPDPF